MQNTCFTKVSKLFLSACLVSVFAVAIPASGQQASTSPASQDVINQQLLDRVKQLEVELKQLKQQPAVVAAAPVPTPEPAPVVEAPRQNEVSERLKFRVFGDVGYAANDGKRVSNTFGIGSLDLFMTARLAPKVTVLGEVLFVSQSDNSVVPDVERLLLQYRHNDYFGFGVGRYHTTIGYYNTAFHQGAWFETAIGRPYMYEFDDKLGFLPLQEVGVTVSGRIPSGKLGLTYVAEVGNGRNHASAEPAQNKNDANNGKSINIAVSGHPAWVSGLDAGFSFYHDHLTFSDGIDHSETTTTAHVVYVTSNYEILNEALLVRHSATTGSQIFHTFGAYTQLSRRFGAYRPYFRYAYLNAPANDPIYGDPTDATLVTRRNGPSLGLRYDFTAHSAFKLQYDRLAIRDQQTSNGLAGQFAFTF